MILQLLYVICLVSAEYWQTNTIYKSHMVLFQLSKNLIAFMYSLYLSN